MKYYPYIYCRTLNVDFRTICYPTRCEIPDSKKNTIQDFVMQVMNTASDGKINNIRYVFFYQEEFVLWGVGILNDWLRLNHNCLEDCKGRRPLRTFIGMLIPANELKNATSLPASIDFFANLFDDIVVPIWNCPDNIRSRKIINSTIKEYNTADKIIELQTKININNNKDVCAFFPSADKTNLLCSLKKCKTNIVTGLNTEHHVFAAANNRISIKFNNVVCEDTQARHIEKLSNFPNTNDISYTNKDTQYNYPKDGPAKHKDDSNFLEKIKSIIKPVKAREQPVKEAEAHSFSSALSGYLEKKTEFKDFTDKPNLKMDNSLMDWGSNWGSESSGNDVNTPPSSQKDFKAGQTSLIAECDAALYAYKTKNEEFDEDLIQLRALLVKIKSGNKNLDKNTITLMESLIDVL